ncbi:hypothetical protein ZIOFF_044738 [Zingiber officinale]|uniref:Uncharacterized protein n=2 Tax=Zingiber officinale TaxID=94328 RepID=A0A8J5FXC4_ZINOF|nr:hypothetical protein ZIOFF_044738 [Zingiber officinale]
MVKNLCVVYCGTRNHSWKGEGEDGIGEEGGRFRDIEKEDVEWSYGAVEKENSRGDLLVHGAVLWLERLADCRLSLSRAMGRSPCCEKVGLKKGPWTPEEDQKLLAYIDKHGHGSWRALPAKAGLQRCGKSCRLRWTNYLRPDIKRGEFSMQEEQTIIQLHALLGNRWSAIATHLPKRTDNEIKNYWNTHLKKRLAKMGIDPCTHKAKSDALSSADGDSRSSTNLSHMAQWESARLEAEARLVRESKLRAVSNPAAILQHPMGTAAASPSAAKPSLDVIRAWLVKHQPAEHGERSDLESPTSTLNFAESRLLMAAAAGRVPGNATAGGYQGGENMEPEIRIDSFAGFSTEHFLAGGGDGEAPWLAETCGWGQFGAGFTGMLLGDKNSGCCGDSYTNNGCVPEEEEEEEPVDKEELVEGGENKSYWNTIFNSINSSSSSTSPPVFYN